MKGQRLKNLEKTGKLLYGGDYNPEQWLDRPDILEEDIRLMKQAGINVATLGVFSWSVLEPCEGEYHLDWLEEIIDNLYKNGIYTVLATPSGSRPVWLDEKYPQARRVDKNGVRHLHGVRHNHCMTSPEFRRKIREMDEVLAKRFGKHPALLLWHISNELGGECYCPLCQEKFHQYLKDKFDNDIEKLNKAWWTTFWSHQYQSFEQIEPPFSYGETSIMGLNLEWKRFTTWNMTDYMKSEIQVFRELTPDIPVTTNFMKLYQGLDYRVLAKELDLVSWDSYPRFHNDYESFEDTVRENSFDHAVMRCMKKNKPFLLMESAPGMVNWHEANKMQRPKVNELMAFQTIACGGDSHMYFQWRKGRGSFEQYHGAVIDHLGRSDTRIYKETCETGKMLEALGEIKSSIIHAKAAVLFDWDNRWAIQDMAGLSKNQKQYEKTCLEQYRILAELGMDVDVVSREDDFCDYRIIAAPMMYMFGENTGEKLKAFVENGGQLIATYLCGYVDKNTLCYLGGFPGDGLTHLFGLYSEEIDSLYPSDRNSAVFADGSSYEIRDFAELLRVQDAEVMASYKDDYYEHMPVVTRKNTGKGNAWYVGARIEKAGMQKVYKLAIDEAKIETKELPHQVEYHVRETKTDKYSFYMNLGSPCQIEMESGMELLSGKMVEGTFGLDTFEKVVIKTKK